MISLQLIADKKEWVIEQLSKRNADYSQTIHEIHDLDQQRREVQKKVDGILGELNELNKEIGVLYKEGKTEEANKIKQKTSRMKEDSTEFRQNLKRIEDEIRDKLSRVPNIPHPDVKFGKGEADNKVIEEEGKIPELHKGALPHWELARIYDLIDFELGSKITGAGFPLYIGKGAKLQRALINYFLDCALKEGYKEYLPPLLVNEDSGFGTGQLPDKDGQMYHTKLDHLYLIPTAEVPITNIYRDVIVREDELPIKCVGYTPCFRREAGSYGKDVRGLNRLHQFDKVEIVQIQHPENSYDTLNNMVEYVKNLIGSLGLPFRTLQLCGGDLGMAAAQTIDLEVYSSAQEKWLEVSSVSNFESYQANRLKLRFRSAEKKNQLAHTLNGSALALPRILAAVLENNQTEHGINIPEVLIPYTGFEKIEQ